MEEKKKFYKKWWFILLSITIYTIAIVGITCLVTYNISNNKTIETGIDEIQEKERKNKEEKIETAKAEMKEIALKEKIKEKDWEITVNEMGFKQDINPSNPNSYYTHYQVKDTVNTYFYIVVDAKNISTLGLRADSVAKVKMKYDEQYEYDTFPVIEESGGGTFTYTNITTIDPLTTRKLYYLVEIPQSIEKDIDKAVNAEITVKDNTYKLKIR